MAPFSSDESGAPPTPAMVDIAQGHVLEDVYSQNWSEVVKPVTRKTARDYDAQPVEFGEATYVGEEWSRVYKSNSLSHSARPNWIGTVSRNRAPGYHGYVGMKNDAEVTVLPIYMKPYLQPKRGVGLNFLKVLEAALRRGALPQQLFDHWTSLNCGDYAMNGSPEGMELWEERLAHVKCDQEVLDKFVAARLQANNDHKKSQNVKAEPAFRIGKGEKANWRDLLKKKGSCVGLNRGACKHAPARTNHVRVNKRPKSRKELRVLNVLFPFYSPGDKSKTRVDMTSICWHAITMGHTDKVNEALATLAVGQYNATAACRVIAVIGNPEWPRIKDLMVRDGACCLDNTSYKDYFKAVGAAARRNWALADGTPIDSEVLSKWHGWHLSTGREMHVIDYVQERKNRSKVIPLTCPFGGNVQADILDALREAVSEIMPDPSNWGSWEDWWRRTPEWVAAGSSGGAKVVVDGETIRLNKKAAAERITNEKAFAWLYEEPEQLGKGSEKKEMGGNRFLIASDLRHYCIEAYVITVLEKVMNKLEGFEQGMKGADQLATFVRRHGLVREAECEALMLDYADFNVQHQSGVMASLFEVIAEEFELRGMHPDAVRAARWIAAAEYNSWIIYPNETERERSVQGMFSGRRGTNFVNSMLNWAYLTAAKRSVAKYINLYPIRLYRAHNGDDVALLNESRLWFIALYCYMKAVGYEFQAVKQLMGVSIAEYLRVLYDSSGAHGYLMRSVATLIEMPLQAPADHSPTGQIASFNAAIRLLFRRGMSQRGCEVLYRCLVEHAQHVKLPNGGGTYLPSSVVRRTFVDGGLCCGPPGQRAMSAPKIAPVPVMRVTNQRLQEAVTENCMSKNLVSVLSEEVQQTFDAKAVLEAAHNAFLEGSIPQRELRDAREKFGVEMKAYVSRLPKWVKMPKIVSLLESLEEPRNEITLDDYGTFAPLWMGMHVPKRVQEPDHDLTLVMRGIGASKFSGIEMFKVAKPELSKLDALYWGLASHTNIAPCVTGSVALANMRNVYGDEVVHRILSGVRTMGPELEAYLHPNWLSWVMDRALRVALILAADKGVRTPERWDLLLADCEYTFAKHAIRDTPLPSMSRY